VCRVRAYLDESVQVGPPGLYVIAAAVVPPAAADGARHELRQVAGKTKQLHWRDESGTRRAAVIFVVAQLDVEHLVAVCTPIDPKRQERSRRHALTRLLWELDQRDVRDVVLETRAHRDKEDRAHIASQQRAQALSRDLRYEFGQPRQEPLLWLPDVVAGAVAYARTGRDTTYLDGLGASVVVLDVEPRG